jgi:hypothetical protein
LSAAIIPTVDDVARIAAMTDPVSRNLQITQTYYELSAALIARTGLSANWCTFATWASKQAGQTIRKEDLARALEAAHETNSAAEQAVLRIVTYAKQLGSRHHADRIQKTIWNVLASAAADRAGNAVGKGNRKVFEEIGREFARFITTCFADSTFDPDKIESFCDELKPGDPPDGQRYLRQAFKRYYQSFFENDVKNHAELLLLANDEIGFHEQTRLQPEIVESLEAAIVDPKEVRNRLIERIFPSSGWATRIRLFFLWLLNRPSPFDKAVESFVTAARNQLRLSITAHLMTIGLPRNVRLRLRMDLTVPFPATLSEIINPELRTLLAQIDPTPDSPRENGAVDWADLTDRMHFIADLFRCYQETRDLFETPFGPEQVSVLKAGGIPGGQL